MKTIKCIGLAVIFTFASCSNNSNETETNVDSGNENTVVLSEAQLKNTSVTTGTLSQKALSETIKVNGMVEAPPQNLVSVCVPMAGYLKSTHLLPGMHLTKGEVIAVLEDQQYIELQRDYLSALARLEAAEAEYNRQKELMEAKAGSDKVFQQTKADYETSKINTKAFSEKLKLINIDPSQLNEKTLSRQIRIYSPFEGFVSKVNVNIGKYVAPTDVMFELVNPNDIHLNLKAFEKDMNKLAVGQTLFASSNTDPGKKYKCEIILISRNISEERTAEVHCHFDQYDKSLLPGMYMNAVVSVGTRQASAVPEQAVLNYEGNHYLFVEKEKNTFEMKAARLGLANEGFVEILNADDFKNDRIVLEGAYVLLMSLKNKSEE